MRIFLLGLGSVGQSLLRIFKENGLFDPDTFFVIDCDRSKKELFIQNGGRGDHFIACMVNDENCLKLLTLLTPGDTFIDLAENIRNLLLLNYCLAHGIHYLNASDSSCDEGNDHPFLHFREFQDAKKRAISGAATSIIEFGMNPGLVSAFVKAGIDEIVERDESDFVIENRTHLKELVEKGRYAETASLLGITKIIEVDNDDQTVMIPYEKEQLYSTWNAMSFYSECSAHPQIAFGTKKEMDRCPNIHSSDQDGCWAMLEGSALQAAEHVYSPQGTVEGFITHHEEIYSIREYLRFRSDAPTVYFVYSPCAYAKRSLAEFADRTPESFHLISRDEIRSGGESVGIILYGTHFRPRYFGNYMLTANVAETATALQVSASLYAAFQYMCKHPHQGLLFPEDTDHHEVLNYAAEYLESYISEEIQINTLLADNSK